jgi:hypothetical protein
MHNYMPFGAAAGPWSSGVLSRRSERAGGMCDSSRLSGWSSTSLRATSRSAAIGLGYAEFGWRSRGVFGSGGVWHDLTVFGKRRRARRELQRAEEALHWARLPDRQGHVVGVRLKPGEVAHAVAVNVRFIEPRRPPGRWASSSSGSSFRVAKRVWLRSGSSRGRYIQGKEQQTVVDEGTFVVTNQRCLFVGTKRSVEWAYSKLIGYTLARDGIAVFNVSNRQRATGVSYGRNQETMLHHVIAGAIAAFNGTQEHQSLITELTSHVVDARDALVAAEGDAALPQRSRRSIE